MGGFMPARILSSFRNLLRKDRVEQALDDELGSSVEILMEEKMKEGLSHSEARRQALLELGGVEQVKEEVRGIRAGRLLEDFAKDVRYALRTLAKSPGFTAVAVLTLALGIGANTAIFSVANAALLRPLPYKDADRLVMLWSTKPREGWRGQASPLDFIAWRQESHSFDSLAAIRPYSFTLTGRGEPVKLFGGAISAGFFETLGIAPQLGRTFTPAECRPGADRVALIGRGLWQESLGSNPGVIGRSIRLNDELFTVIGVMPDALQFPVDGLKVWVPLALNESRPDDRHNLFVVGRLKEKRSVGEAQVGVATIAARLEREFPQSHAGYRAAVIPLRESFAGSVRPALRVLFGAVALVLLIACANVASLLLARASARTWELGLRAALGATQWRLTRSMLVESVLLALAGGALGVALAGWGVQLLLASVPAGLPLPSYLRTITVDSHVVGFTLVLSLMTGVLFGVLPALRASRVDPNTTLKEGEGRTTAGLHQGRLRSTLIVAELALTIILLVGAGLLMQTAVRLQRTDPGLRPDHVLVMDVSLPAAGYHEPQQKVAFYRETLERVRALPGVRQAGLVNDLPMRGWTSFNFTIEGRPAPPPGEVPEALERVVSPGYFQAMAIPLLRGRTFSDNDGPTTPPVAMVNQALVNRYLRGVDPVGHRIRPGGPESSAPWYRIVGVVGDVRQLGIDAGPKPEFYKLYAQDPWPEMTLAVRTESDPMGLAVAVKEQIWTADPNLPIFGVARMTQVLSDSLWPSRILASLEGTFAILALIMASVGLYGVISQAVTLRQHEFGVRLALGAEPAQILRLVLSQGLKLILVGLGIGLLGAAALTRSLSALLHQVSPTDPWTFAPVSLLLTVVGLTACWLPARRAAQVDPMVALRNE
jgi:predicted permease